MGRLISKNENDMVTLRNTAALNGWTLDGRCTALMLKSKHGVYTPAYTLQILQWPPRVSFVV